MNTGNSDYRPSTRFGPLRGHHVLAGFVLFFGIVFGVNACMIYGALSTFDGIETEGAYQKGRAYNHLLERMEAQRALGWRTSLAAAPLPAANGVTRGISRCRGKAGSGSLRAWHVLAPCRRGRGQGRDAARSVARHL